MGFQIEELIQNLFQIDFDNQNELLTSFMRFQEHYESPKFKGKIFTWKEFAKEYKKNKKSKQFTYTKDWHGCNIPSYVLEPFKQGLFDPLTKREQEFLNHFDKKQESFYIIGTYAGSDADEHEIAHGLFYLNSEYRIKVLEIVHSIQALPLKEWLASNCYSSDVFDDEIHAYLLDGIEYLKDDLKIEITEDMRSAAEKLNQLFSQYKPH